MNDPIEAFLQHLHRATNTRILNVAKSVIDLIDFEFEPTLMKIATFPLLHTLKLPGLKLIDIGKETMEEFLLLLQNNCTQLHTLGPFTKDRINEETRKFKVKSRRFSTFGGGGGVKAWEQ